MAVPETTELNRRDRLIEGLSRELMMGIDAQAALQAVVNTARGLVTARSVVLFLPDDEGKLAPAASTSPEKERLAGARLAGLSEPLAEQAYAGGLPVSRPGLGVEGEPLLASEKCAVALPLGGGVLYLGRENPPLEPAEINGLRILADRSGLALASAVRQRKTEARESDKLTYALTEQVHLLQRLVDGSSRLAGLLQDPEAIKDSLGTLIVETLPHDAGALTGENGELMRTWGEQELLGKIDLTALRGTVAEHGKPLLYPDLVQSRFAKGQDCPRSLVCAPVAKGLLVLTAGPVGSYGREHLDLLTLVAGQAASALENARLYAEVVAAGQLLESSHQQLVQASKLSAIGQLAAGVAHELNTPLGAASLSLEMIEMTGQLDMFQLKNAQEALERAQYIVDKLLTYSRKSPQQQELVRPDEAVAAVSDLLVPQLRQRKVTLETAGSTTKAFEARAVEIHQVLVNLVLNAADTYKGPGRVLLSVAESAGLVGFEVRDWGGGIPESVQQMVFDPFFTTKPVGKGTGLGLSISLEIVEGFGGLLQYDTKVGEGTVFRVLFPVKSR